MSRRNIDWGKAAARTAAALLLTVLLFAGAALQPAMAAEAGAAAASETGSTAGAGTAAAVRDGVRLTLQEAVDLALQHNVELLQGEVQVETARIGLEQVRAMSLLEPSPTLLLQTETGLELARRNVALSRQRIAFEVESAYYDVLRLQNVLLVLDDALKMTARQLDVAESRRRTGVATDNDVLKARTSLMQLEADRAEAADGLALLFVRLRQMLGLSPGTPVELVDDVVTEQPLTMSLEEALAEASEQRIELAQVRLAVELAERELDLATNDYTPELTRLQAELELQKAKLQLRQAEDGIALDVHNAYNSVHNARRRLEVAEQKLLEMEENVRIVQALFDARMATDVELLQGQAGLTEARTAVVNAVFDYNAARAAFFQAIAREFERR